MVKFYLGEVLKIWGNQSSNITTMKLSAEFVALLCCPVSGDNLKYDWNRKIFISKKAGLAYPIVDGIPCLLELEARKLSGLNSKT